MLAITYRPCWQTCDFQFFKINKLTKTRTAIDDLLKFAAEIERGYGKWDSILGGQIRKANKERRCIEAASTVAPISRAKTTLEFYKEQFNDHLNKTLRDLETGSWWELFQDRSHPNNKVAQLSERIGELQREKIAGHIPISKKSLKGENDYVLESTHEVFFSANRDFPEIGRAFDSLIDALEVIDHATEGIRVLKIGISREEWMREIGRRLSQGWIYLFLLYFTYLVIEAPHAPRTMRSRKLLEKNRFFSLLSGHGAGINSAFFGFHGAVFFCRGGEGFHNLYFQKYTVHEDDTLRSVIHKNYQNGHIDFAACLQGLVECHEFLRGIPVTARLQPILKPLGITSVTIVPPGPRENPYQNGVTEMQNWVKKRNASK